MDPGPGPGDRRSDPEGDRRLNAIAIETATRPGSVGVRGASQTRVASLDADSTHARDLLPTIERLCGETDVERQALDEIYVGIGPGSYTGLRVGMATALGLAYAAGATLRAVPSFEALAFEALEPGEEGMIAWNARARRFYFAHYLREQEDVTCVVAPSALAAEELREKLAGNAQVFGDTTIAEAAQLEERILERVRVGVHPTAAGILALGPKRDARALEELEPLYLRSFGD